MNTKLTSFQFARLDALSPPLLGAGLNYTGPRVVGWDNHLGGPRLRLKQRTLVLLPDGRLVRPLKDNGPAEARP